jgi:septum site-determining protein MinD
MRIISVVSGKGGVGKTTITSNLGVVLSSVFGKNVIAIDCNLTTPHLGLFLGLDYTPTTINHVLKGEAEPTEAIYNHPSGMKVMPSSVPLKEMEGVDSSLLGEVVKKIYNRYLGRTDIVLLDCAPGLGREALAGIRASDEILFVTIPYMPALMDIIRCNHLVRETGVRHLGVALNIVGRGKHEMSREEVEGAVGLPVLAEIPSDKNILKSLSKSIPVATSHPKSKASREIRKLASAILRHSMINPSFSFNWKER